MAKTELAEYPVLTEEQRAFYDENGYFIIENAIEPVGLERVRQAFERREAETRD